MREQKTPAIWTFVKGFNPGILNLLFFAIPEHFEQISLSSEHNMFKKFKITSIFFS